MALSRDILSERYFVTALVTSQIKIYGVAIFDISVMQLCRMGDENMGIEEKREFLRQLYIDNVEWLISLARRWVNDDELAKDVAHDAFVVAQKKIDELITHPNPVGWLYITAHHIADRERRKACHKELPLENHEYCLTEGQSEPEPSLEELLPDEFSADEKKLLVLRFEEQCSYAEISERCGMSQANCRQKMSRLKKKFRNIYKNPQNLSQKMLDGR